MYNKQYFEVGNEYKIIGNYCIHRYDKNDIFDSIFDEEAMLIGYITKYDCNHIVAWLYDDHIEKTNNNLGNYVHDIHFGSRLYNKLDKAADKDKRALKFLNDLYMRDSSQCDYILIYNNNDLLK